MTTPLRNRNTRADLVLLQNTNSELQRLLVAVEKPLTNRSLIEPALDRGRWQEASRAERSPLAPYRIEQDMLRAAARAAVKDGRPAVIDAVREAIRNYFDARTADVLSELPPEMELDPVSAYLQETKAQGMAEPEQATAVTIPTLVNYERASEGSKSYRRRLDAFIDACDRKVKQMRSARAHLRALT